MNLLQWQLNTEIIFHDIYTEKWKIKWFRHNLYVSSFIVSSCVSEVSFHVIVILRGLCAIFVAVFFQFKSPASKSRIAILYWNNQVTGYGSMIYDKSEFSSELVEKLWSRLVVFYITHVWLWNK